MTVRELIDVLQQVENQNLLVTFADGSEVLTVYELTSEVVLSDADSE